MAKDLHTYLDESRRAGEDCGIVERSLRAHYAVRFRLIQCSEQVGRAAMLGASEMKMVSRGNGVARK